MTSSSGGRREPGGGRRPEAEVPRTADEVVILLHAAFQELAGVDLAADAASSVYRQQYAHGGMSSGMISLDAWRQRLMPMLAERAKRLLAD